MTSSLQCSILDKCKLTSLTNAHVTLWLINARQKCVTPNNEEAECVSIYSCKILIDALKTEQSEAIEFVRKSICEGRESDRMVCCGSTSKFLTPMINNNSDKDKLLPDRIHCGYQHSDDYFRVEVSDAGINEFPWLASLLYKENNETARLCSGSLISNRYVLTSAHCIIDVPDLVGVRLGEYIINDGYCTEESSFYGFCDPPQNFDIEKMIPHPQFNATKFIHDIGLLRLNETVQYSDYMRPICLPTTGTVFAKPGDTLSTSGWGVQQRDVEQTDTKKTLSSKLITNEECAAVRNYEKVITENHICTKETEDKMDFFCVADNGAPGMFSFKHQWHQEGVLAFGGGCNLKHLEVYTKVVNYLDWIKENIEP